MAADLVQSPDTQQTFIHDLESFFWVLLWIVLTQVETSWDNDARSSFLSTTFSPKVYGRTGGSAKLMFLSSDGLDQSKFSIPNNPKLAELLREVKKLFSYRHKEKPKEVKSIYDPLVIDGGEGEDLSQSTYQGNVALYDRYQEYLRSHSTFLHQPARALHPDEHWPENDRASPQPFVPSVFEVYGSTSGTKRSRALFGSDPSSSSKRHQL